LWSYIPNGHTRNTAKTGDTMQLIPALDIQQGRLIIRNADGAQIESPEAISATAQNYQTQGFSWLHLYDLDAAAGRSMNAAAVGSVLNAVSIPVQVAGGINAINRLSYWLEVGVTRVVLDSRTVLDPGFLNAATRLCADRIAGAVEISRGHLIIDGKPQMLSPEDAARRFADAGMRTLLVVDHDREAQLRGANVALMADMARAAGVSVIACGGVSSDGDIAALKARHGIRGAVIGRALADGLMQASSALATAAA